MSRSPGPSLSVGVRGAQVTVGRRGVTRTVGNTGDRYIFYMSSGGHHTGFHSAHRETPLSAEEWASQSRQAEWILAAIMLLVAIVLTWMGRS